MAFFHIPLNGNFHENLCENFFDPFCRTFLTIKSKMKVKMKMEYGKMSPIFEFSVSKLDYVAIFRKTQEKKFLPIFQRHFQV